MNLEINQIYKIPINSAFVEVSMLGLQRFLKT